jgi:acetylornithine deacetylase/succinyl-diaminopimelate desuccinylase-like protein
VLEHFKEVGFTDVHLEETADGSQAVVGSRPCPNPDAPTVLLYAHYDVQPPLDDDAWRTPPFELTEVDGRWYGRGTADCKGNILMHLTALRALGEDIPVHLKLVVEGSEEQGTGGLEAFVPAHADLLRADTILVCDTGNAAVGRPAATVSLRGMVNVVVTVEALGSELHSGMFGGAAPDALAALVAILASLRDRHGNTTIMGLDNTQTWSGEPYPTDQFRHDATVLDEVSLLGDGSVSDMLWARPAVTILGIDCPPVVGSASAIVPRAAARLNLRNPPGMSPDQAEAALVEHLRAAAPWGVRVTVETEAAGAPFKAEVDGPAYMAMAGAMQEAYGTTMTTLGQGGSIPLCNVLADTYPGTELILMGVEEPQALIHAPNESVDPSEIEAMALTEALFLQRYATTTGPGKKR